MSFTPPNVDASAILESDRIAWQAFAGEETIALASEGKTVFIDFTADWCATCKTFEQVVIETDEVAAKIRDNGVVAVKADWTRHDDEIRRWVNHFGSSSIPLYVVLPAGKPGQPIVMADQITRRALLDALDEAGASVTPPDPAESVCAGPTGSC